MISLVVFMFTCSIFVDACYITNCPWGGKRSIENKHLFNEQHQCLSCANGAGTCFGPKICCGSGIGCFIDTKETHNCRLEDAKSNVACTTYGKSCSALKYGKCATSGLCCSPEYCVPDSNCGANDEEEYDLSEENHVDLKHKNFLKLLMKLLRQSQ